MCLYIDKKLTVAQKLLIDLICQSATGVTIQLWSDYTVSM